MGPRCQKPLKRTVLYHRDRNWPYYFLQNFLRIASVFKALNILFFLFADDLVFFVVGSDPEIIIGRTNAAFQKLSSAQVPGKDYIYEFTLDLLYFAYTK
jgi:hypothetical protein